MLRNSLDRAEPQWTRDGFLRQSSLAQRAAIKWRETALEKRRKKSNAAILAANGSYPPVVITDPPPLESPGIATATANQTFDVASQRVDPADLCSPSHEGNKGATSSFFGHTEEVGRKPFRGSEDYDSIAFHVRAIVRDLQSQLSAFFSRIARWLMPRSDCERRPDELV